MNKHLLISLGYLLNDVTLTAPVKVVTIAMAGRPARQDKFLDVKELPDSVPVLAFSKEQQDVDVFHAANKNLPCIPKVSDGGKTIEPMGACKEKQERDTIVYTKTGELCYVLNSEVIGLHQHQCSLIEALNNAAEGKCEGKSLDGSVINEITNDCVKTRKKEDPSSVREGDHGGSGGGGSGEMEDKGGSGTTEGGGSEGTSGDSAADSARHFASIHVAVGSLLLLFALSS